jgi:thymidylate synthase (FAD)
MKVDLLHYTPLEIADTAIGKCWGKGCMPTVEKRKERMDRVVNKHKHTSTIEHINFNFDIDGISRACLQELARHRISSFSVKSSRYTLKELKNEEPFCGSNGIDKNTCDNDRAGKYIVFTGNPDVDFYSIQALDNLRDLISKGVANDIAKYALPECYKTSLIWSVNARSLQNFLTLRRSKDALWEIRDLANTILDTIPEEYRFLFPK